LVTVGGNTSYLRGLGKKWKSLFRFMHTGEKNVACGGNNGEAKKSEVKMRRRRK